MDEDPRGTGAPSTPMSDLASDPTAPFAPAADPRPDDAPWPEMTWPPAPGTRLRGAVVELDRVDPDRDADALFAAVDHDACWTHVAGRPADPAALAAVLRARADAGWWTWLLRLVAPVAPTARDGAEAPVLAPGTVVGTSSYLDASTTDARLEVGATALSPAVWGTAVNPEAKLLLLGHALDVLGAGRVQLKTDVRNTRSQQAIARLGASPEGVLRRYQRRTDGSVRDTALFSVTAEDWPAVRAGLEARLARPPR